MAAAITTTATTLEGQILELVNTANSLEQALPEDENLGLFNVAFDSEAGTVNLTIALNATYTSNGAVVEVAAQEYLP